MKQTIYFLIFVFAIGFASTSVAQVSNDDCSTAMNLGTLPAPAACGTATTGTKNGTIVSVSGSNVGATPSNPYPYSTSCAPGGTTPNDVWYVFTASSPQTRIALTAATFTNPVITVYEGNCNNLSAVGCISVTGGAATLTLTSTTPGYTYYIQVAGANGSQSGTFTMNVRAQINCANCLVGSTFTASPPSVNGTYAAGQTVTFCDSIYGWNETSANWLHGITPSFGSGWDLTTIVPGASPSPCTSGGTWSWYPNGQTSSARGVVYGAGFYYETAAGNNNGVLDSDPGNNFGDEDLSNCSWKFCVTITTQTSATCTPGSNLDVKFSVTGDGQSGSWTSLACQNNPVADIYSVGACCPPGMASTPTNGSSNNGTATATPVGNNSPWTFQWSNGVTQSNITTPSTIMGLAAGFDTVTVTDASGCVSTAIVQVISTCAIDAGPDQAVSCFPINNSATMAGTGTGTWSAGPSNPGTAIITTPTSATTTITNFSVIGTYQFVFSGLGCTDTAVITVTGKPNAGPDQTVSCVILPGGSATMAAVGIGSWSPQSNNPGTATITAPGSPTTTITTFSAAGVYNFIWTSGGCTDTAAVVVVPKPNAGPDQTVSCVNLPGGSATMGASGFGFWAAQTGNPGTATITSTISPTTTITNFSAPGTYYFIWSIGVCTDTAAVVVTAIPNAGPDQTVSCYPLNTTATMAAAGTGTWTAESGNPAGATITSPSSSNTTITFTAAGVYNFIWTNASSCADTAAVTVTANPNAGPDQTVICAILPGGSATMAAVGIGAWSAQSNNPGTSAIGNASNPTTSITNFSVAGTYNFIWTNGSCSDTASVIVTAKPDAGVDQFVACYPLNNSTTMAASGTGTWSPLAGNPGTSTITSPTAANTTITTFSTIGVYGYVWTSGSCTDTALVTVTANPNAGPDQTVLCANLPGGSTTMAATGTGSWSAQSNNPGTALITSATNPTTTITSFSAAGIYNFIWTNGSCSDTAAVTVTAQPNAGPDQTVSCIIAPGGIATMAASGIGTWTADPANTATATISNPADPATNITTFSAAGTYNFIWTNGLCADTAVVTVTTKPDAGPDATVCPNGIAILNAVGTGSWSALSSNPAITTIASPGTNTTNVSGFTISGSYGYVWTVNGCTDTASVMVNASPTLSPSVVNITCTNPIGVINANASGASPFTFQWSTGSASDSIHTTTAGLLYTVTVTDNNQCTASASDSVSNQIVTVTVTGNPTNVSCYGYNDGQIILDVTPPGTYTYIWNTSGSRDTLTSLSPGTYAVTATDANGCSGTGGPFIITQPGVDSVSITPLDTVVFLGDTIQLNSTVMGTYPAITYTWTPTVGLSCSNCPNPLLITTDFDTVKTAYQLTITYNNGCTATGIDSILAKPNDMSAIPNAFTPNGDDKNAVFKILATGVKDFRMNIYNRWGQQVFSTTDITAGWDGSYGRTQEPTGTYLFFYSITYHDGKVESKEGSFNLFR